MRKLILISALLLASASAHAGEQLKGLVVADSDRPAASDTAQPLPPVSESEKPKKASEPARPLASQPSRRAQAERYEAEQYEARRYEAKRFEAKRFEARRFREAKARRIAARYGISW
jgi:hypothetical protein